MKNKRIISAVSSLILLLGLIFPSYSANIKVGDSVILGGMPFGVKFYSGNMTVNGFTEVDGENGLSSPAYEAGIRENDVILNINGNEASSAEAVTREVEKSEGRPISFICTRNGKELEFTVTPIKSIKAGTYKIGLWIKDSTAGIGTITYIDPETGEFGGLGHGICSSETGELLKIRRGIVSSVKISGIIKGKEGTPGELKGYFSSRKIGIVNKNTVSGVFGVLTDHKSNFVQLKTLPIAASSEIKNGKASIYCTLTDTNPIEYEVEICRNNSSNSIFDIIVTDKDLINKTGGIVQGMSGSPIIQNGKLIGAVTHVLVNDPTRGYGIFAENMLETAQGIAQTELKEAS